MNTPPSAPSSNRANRALDSTDTLVVGLLVWFFLGMTILYFSGIRPDSLWQRVLFSLAAPLVYAIGESALWLIGRTNLVKSVAAWIDRRTRAHVFSIRRIGWGVLGGVLVVGVLLLLMRLKDHI